MPTQPRRIGFLGTGIMGGHMSRRLAQAGFDVTAWNRTPDKAERLAPYGVKSADAPSAAVCDADVAIVMLSNGPVVDEVLFTSDGSGRKPADTLRTDATLLVMSSIPVETCRAQAELLAPRGVRYIDAPVSGGEPGARDGTLAIMAGGAEDHVAALADVFAPLGRVTRIGPVGTGQMTKLANQIIVGGTIIAIAEALHFVSQGGADAGAVRKALMGGFAESKILNLHGERMVERNFVPGSPAEYQLKDLRTAQGLAGEMGLHLTLLDTMTGVFEDMISHLGNGVDVAGILREVERRSGTSKASEEIHMTGRVEFSVNDGIASIVLARPDKHNAITPDMAQELGRACREVDGTDGVRVAVISGAGEKAFSAGSDLNLLADLSDIWAFRSRLEYAAVVRDIRKPVIAALKGWVLGGGMEIALAADVRVAGRSTRIGGPEVSRGWVGGGGASQMLPRLVGYGHAMRMLLLGEPVEAEAALRMGLIEELVDDDLVLTRAHEMAAKIASFSPIATQAVKASVRAAMSMPLEAGLRYENEIHVICMSAKDRLEGIKAFQEGRKATFSGN